MISEAEPNIQLLKEELKGSSIEITFYTDPLCCWSWGLKPQLQQLLNTFGEDMSLTYCMCGMIKNWESSTDLLHSINKPAQMGPMWMQAATKMNMPLNYMIWENDPPSSSYPACLAVTATRLQSETIAEKVLLKLWESVMEKGLNISKPEVIYTLVEEISATNPQLFDVDHFKRDLHGLESRKMLKEDLKKAALDGVDRYPSLVIRNNKSKRSVKAVGYRTYKELLDLLSGLSSRLEY
ncbi:DsbA family protein [Marivirga sp. S37H4]|uniref:DsbA family protein n=1 Tax=Marivirga aurantiaca TaxID=2802615 RepID=A0A934WW89_9BACT|nr:DsbA family protein [Marivirga aurantiaca]MBK6264081.1 DsbA family protein [Marivirga aurantiaca]